VRIKLDENITTDASVVARDLGHDIDTVNAEGLTGAPDVDVLAAATRGGRLLVTLDRGFGDVRAHPPGPTPGSSYSALNPRTRKL
jgi:predicted nuclease of predicted toxin-antitoxin system